MKTVLITGGTGGIGSNIVKFLLKTNNKVIIWAREEKKFNTLCTQLTKEELNNLTFDSIDVSDKDKVKEGTQKLDTLDILINTAGCLLPIGKTAEVDLDQFKKAVETIFLGTLHACYFTIPLLLNSSKGKIINFSGGGSAYGRENHAAYGCSKTAVVRLTENFSIEYPTLDINVIAPGMHKTPLWKEETFDKEPAQWANMNELIEFIEFLVSDQSNGITGRFLHFKEKGMETLRKAKQDPDLYKLRRVDDFKFSKLKE